MEVISPEVMQVLSNAVVANAYKQISIGLTLLVISGAGICFLIKFSKPLLKWDEAWGQ
jgi:hypothetical protein